MTIAYGWEARSIQDYILKSGKLKDMVGASELVDRTGRSFLDKVVIDLGLKENDVVFPRRTGGAITAFFEDRQLAENFRDLWSLRIQKEVPGLNFCHALVEGTEVPHIMAKLQAQLNQDRNRTLPVLPLTSPLAKRYDRTGLVAVTQRHEEFLDEMTMKKREAIKERVESKALKEDEVRFLESRLNPEGMTLVWPKVLEPEFEGDPQPTLLDGSESKRYVAIIHADGNNLGQILAALKEAIPHDPLTYAQQWSAFSTAIEKATLSAFHSAISHWAKKQVKMPARPIILGGDDLTVIVRADLALNFVKDFLEAFERTTAEAFHELRAAHNLPLPTKLTACAGITFIKASQPFHQAYTLAESLCKAAKASSKAIAGEDGIVPASLAFHRITTGMIDDWDEILSRELTPPGGGRLTMQPYALEKTSDMPSLLDLKELQDTLKKFSKGAVRELSRLLREDAGQVEPALRRWRENMQKSNDKGELSNLVAHLNTLTDGGHAELKNLPPIYDQQKRTPLGDAMALRGIGGIK